MSDTIMPIINRVTEDTILVLFEGMAQKEFKRPKGEKNDPAVIAFDELKALADKGEWQAFLNALRPNNKLSDVIKDDELVEGLVVEKGRVSYKGFRLNTSLTRKIVGLLADANRSGTKVDAVIELKPLVALLGRVVGNVDNRVVSELFDFVAQHKVIVSDSGKLVSLYVTINKDGKNGRHDLAEATEWTMPRNMVSADTELKVLVHSRLHKPSEGSKVRRVVVDPADVVSVGSNSLVVCQMEIKESIWNDSWDD